MRGVCLECREYGSWCLPRPLSRSALGVKCSRGFGVSKQTGSKSGNKAPAKTPQQAADQAFAAAAKHRPNVRPINPKEAAKGRVDHVQVQDWANGQAGDLGELKVVPGTYGAAYTTAGGDAGQPSVALYQQLAQHAQYLQSQGALSIALEPGAKPFLPFEQWQFTMPRYRQYMADLASVHQALEQALQLALPSMATATTAAAGTVATSGAGSLSTGTSGPKSSGSSNSSDGTSRSNSSLHPAYDAIACYSVSCGLWRAAAAEADLAALERAAAAPSAQPDSEQQQHGRATTVQQRLKQVASSNVSATQTAVAYGKYLLQLGRAAAAPWDAASSTAHGSNAGAQPQHKHSSMQSCSSSGASSSSRYELRSSGLLQVEQQEGLTAALKLLAHAYALHVQQQCLGARIGAAATDALGLMSPNIAAAAVYTQYPSHVGEPVQQLICVTDAAGALLDATGRQVVLNELPRALRKATLILAPLATA